MLECLSRSLKSLKVIRSDLVRPDTYDFLLVVRSIYGPISYHFLDKRRFRSKKTQIFPGPYSLFHDGLTVGILYRFWAQILE